MNLVGLSPRAAEAVLRDKRHRGTLTNFWCVRLCNAAVLKTGTGPWGNPAGAAVQNGVEAGVCVCVCVCVRVPRTGVECLREHLFKPSGCKPLAWLNL